LLAAFFLIWFLSLGALAARSVPFGTYKSPLTRAIDDALASFVGFSLFVVPVIIYFFVSKKSRQFYKLERARQSQEIKDIISNF
jgi:membrane protease YdiL (CAAX protease family)